MTKVLTILGARPQFVKGAVLSRAISKNDHIQEVIVHTGQHFDQKMSDIFFEEMNIPSPDYNLNINSLSHGAMTGRMIEGIEEVILKEKPDALMVYGDTNSTIAGALAAKKLDIKVAHVEAGLRSFNMKMPEEINRILTDRISDLLLCPTQTAIDNLRKEGFDHIAAKIVLTGDIMFDAALYYAKLAQQKSTIIEDLDLSNKDFVLCTVHRQENTDDKNKLASIIQALNEINENTPVVFPLHPRTKKLLQQYNITCHCSIIDPVGYFDMIQLLKRARLVVTDSGGLQKEAYYFQKNSITLREQTEWVELIKNSYSMLTGSDIAKIREAYTIMMSKPTPEIRKELFGDGHSADIMMEALLKI